MSSTHLKTPLPVIASAVQWKHPTGPTPAVRIAGARGTVYVGADDLEQLARAVSEALTQKIEQGVTA